MSVSMFWRITGEAMASSSVKASMVSGPLDRTDGGDGAGDGGGRGHRRAGEMGAPTRTLAADEVAGGGRYARLPRRDGVAVDREAHRAAGLAPFEDRLLEDAVDAL